MSFDPKTKILSAAYSPPLYHQNVSIGQLAMHYLLRDSSKVVQVCFDDGVELTAGEMAKLGSRIAHNLFKAGLDLGDVIGMVAKNSTYVTPIVLGCFLNGCPVSTVDPTFEINEIANMFKQTKPKLVFCDHENWRTVVEALRLCGNASKAVTVDEKLLDVPFVAEMFQLLEGEEFVQRNFSIDSTKLCSVILCSSGTTAMSKGTMLSSAQCIAMTRLIPLVSHPTILCFSSLYWVSGFYSLLYSLINVSTRVITTKKFSPLLMVHLIEKYKVNVVLSPPSVVAQLLQSPVLNIADLSTIRMFMVTGGGMPQHMRQSLQDHLLYGSVLMLYGMTEVAGVVASTIPFQPTSNSVGQLASNYKMKIVDEDGNALDKNEIGEIYLLNPLRFLGYASNPEATRDAFDAKGWLRTGDLGYINDNCEIYVVDRIKDMIKYMNYQVAPSEIEACILKMEGVLEVCVVGIPDMLSGDLAAALVVKEMNSNLTEQDIVDEVARHLPLVKRLHGGAYFVDQFPFTASGKIKKRIMREIAVQLYRSKEINGNY